MTKPDQFDSFPLREQKRARTRVALVEALLPRLSTQTLDDVSVADLCHEAGISQATFFNYFPTKGHLLLHFVQLWSLRVGVVAREAEVEHDSALAALEAVFATTAEETAATPQVMLELIAAQARLPVDATPAPIEPAERALFLPGVASPMTLPDRGLGQIVPALLGEAVARGELPPGTDLQSLTLATVSVFFGVPLVIGRASPDAVAPAYRRQLRLLWDGCRAQEQP